MKYPISILKEDPLKTIMLFHMPPESFKLILDPTCGKKRMWNGWAEATTLYKITFADSGNFGQELVCEFKDHQGVYDGIIFDPPYLFGINGSKDTKDFGDYAQTYDELVSYIAGANDRFPSILRQGGKLIVKCSDQYNVAERRFYSHHITWANNLTNFKLIDIFISPHHHISGTAWQVKNRPSSIVNFTYYLVFSKRESLNVTAQEGDTSGAKSNEAKCLNCGLDHDSAKFVKDIEADSTALAISMAREREEKGLRYVG